MSHMHISCHCSFPYSLINSCQKELLWSG